MTRSIRLLVDFGDAKSIGASEDNIVNDIKIAFDDSVSDNDNRPDANELLYAGATITLGQSMMSILSFMLSYNLTGAALSDVLALISLYLQQPHLLKTSVYYF